MKEDIIEIKLSRTHCLLFPNDQNKVICKLKIFWIEILLLLEGFTWYVWFVSIVIVKRLNKSWSKCLTEKKIWIYQWACKTRGTPCYSGFTMYDRVTKMFYFETRHVKQQKTSFNSDISQVFISLKVGIIRVCNLTWICNEK